MEPMESKTQNTTKDQVIQFLSPLGGECPEHVSSTRVNQLAPAKRACNCRSGVESCGFSCKEEKKPAALAVRKGRLVPRLAFSGGRFPQAWLAQPFGDISNEGHAIQEFALRGLQLLSLLSPPVKPQYTSNGDALGSFSCLSPGSDPPFVGNRDKPPAITMAGLCVLN